MPYEWVPAEIIIFRTSRDGSYSIPKTIEESILGTIILCEYQSDLPKKNENVGYTDIEKTLPTGVWYANYVKSIIENDGF